MALLTDRQFDVFFCIFQGVNKNILEKTESGEEPALARSEDPGYVGSVALPGCRIGRWSTGGAGF